jgi:hypothetical protein
MSHGIDCAPNRESGIRVDVDLYDLEVPRLTFGEVFKHRRDHPTGPAPGRPETATTGTDAVVSAVKGVGVRVDDPRKR